MYIGKIRNSLINSQHCNKIVQPTFSMPVEKFRDLLLSPWCRPWSGYGCHTLTFYDKSFLCDGQGTVRQAILYADRSCSLLGLTWPDTWQQCLSDCLHFGSKSEINDSAYWKIQWTLDIANSDTYLIVPSDIKENCLDAFPFFIYISTSVVSNYWYLKANFLGPEHLLWDIDNVNWT